MLGQDRTESDVGAARAQVRPPAGICTGDYSKFTELRGRLHGAAAPAAGASSNPAAGQPVVTSGIVTASQLRRIWETSPDGVALLTADARLTPLASDLVRQHPQKMRRMPAASGASTGVARGAAPAWIWWSDGGCRAAEQIVAMREARFLAAVAAAAPSVLGSVVRDLAAALRGGRAAGGVLFVRSAALAMCYANRCASIRAVVGTCGEAVEEGIRDLGANLLVIEYPHVGPEAMEAMVDRMTRQLPVAPPRTLRDLADLHRCG